jgi:hypothetical protein
VSNSIGGKLMCKAGDGPECLTKGQIERGDDLLPQDPKTGRVLLKVT